MRAGFSFAFKRLQNVLRQWGVEITRHGELTLGETDGAQSRQRRGVDDGEQAGGFFGQALRTFRDDVSVVKFDFNGQITHGVKLRRCPDARKRRFAITAILIMAGKQRGVHLPRSVFCGFNSDSKFDDFPTSLLDIPCSILDIQAETFHCILGILACLP